MFSEALKKEENHIRRAWIAGLFSTVVTFIFAIIGNFNETIRYKYEVDFWSLIDVAIIGGLTYGVYKKNRWSALALFIYFFLSKIAMLIGGRLSGGLFGFIIIYFFLMGTIAAFKRHKYLVENEEIILPARKSRGPLFYIASIIGGLVLIIFSTLMIVGAMSPPVEVIPGKQVDKEYISFAREQDLLEPRENMHFWYSDAMIDFKSGFYFFTDSKVVVYSKDWEEPALVMPFEEITDIEFEHQPSAIEDSQVTLYLKDESFVYFPLSSDNGGDLRFYEKMKKIWKKASALPNEKGPHDTLNN